MKSLIRYVRYGALTLAAGLCYLLVCFLLGLWPGAEGAMTLGSLPRALGTVAVGSASFLSSFLLIRRLIRLVRACEYPRGSLISSLGFGSILLMGLSALGARRDVIAWGTGTNAFPSFLVFRLILGLPIVIGISYLWTSGVYRHLASGAHRDERRRL